MYSTRASTYIFYTNFYFLVGSTCSMLNENDYMASTTTLQSHVPQIIETLDLDETEDTVEGEKISLNR